MTEGFRRKKIAIVLNGISLHKKVFFRKILPALQKEFDVEVSETLTRNHAIGLASRAVEQFKFDAIIAAGGDGTLNQVVHGVLKNHENESKLPAVGLIPLGSGNDFARSANLKADAEQIIGLLQKFAPGSIDIGSIAFTDFDGKPGQRYFINVADLGMGPEVVRHVNESGRTFGAAFAYYQSIISTFMNYRPMKVVASADEWEWSGKVRSLAIANGKYYGHGLCVAPDAILDDGVLDAFICGNVSVLDFIRYSETLKKGKHVRIPEIQYKRCKSVSFVSEMPCLIEGDGEVLGFLPASVNVADRKLDFLK